MLLRNIVSFSLLALQAGFSVAKPLPGREASNVKQGPKLLSRADKEIFGGAETGNADDTILTYGLATCVGMAASGTAGDSGINKVLAHIQCAPEGSNAEQQMREWVDAVRSSASWPLRDAQNALNNLAKDFAQSVGSYATHTRKSVADPRPSGELKINLDGSITVGGKKVM